MTTKSASTRSKAQPAKEQAAAAEQQDQARDVPAKDGATSKRTRIQVRARREGGRRRCGIRFTREWQTLAMADLTLEQVEAIGRDPQLECREV